MADNLLRAFTHLTIPAEIWLRKDISIQAKCLWAELRSLHDKEKGGCFASEDYLMEFLSLGRSRLYEILKELKDACLMEVVGCDGRNTTRRAIVPEVEYQSGQQLSGKPDSPSPESRTPKVRDPGFTPYIENKEDNKEERERTRTPKKKKKNEAISEQKTSYRENVTLTKEQYEKHLALYGQEKLNEMLDLLNTKKAANGYSYKSDYHALASNNWVHREYEKQKNEYLRLKQKDCTSKHFGLQKDTRPVHPSRTIDFREDEVGLCT